MPSVKVAMRDNAGMHEQILIDIKASLLLREQSLVHLQSSLCVPVLGDNDVRSKHNVLVQCDALLR